MPIFRISSKSFRFLDILFLKYKCQHNFRDLKIMKNLTKTFLSLGLVSLLGLGGMSQEASAAQTSASTPVAKTNTVAAKTTSVTYKKKTRKKRSKQQRAYQK